MSGTWNSLYSQVGNALKPSPIRELLKLTKKPGMISFAGGMPDPQVFPVKEFLQATSILEKEGKSVLQYGATDGYEPLKEFLAQWMAPRMGRVTKPEEMLITTGSQQVMDLFAAVMLDPGDAVLLEAPSYPGALHALRNRNATFISVPCDDDGMMVSQMPEIIEKARKEGKKIKFIYTIVNFQNPSGSTLTKERRIQLLEVAKKYGIPIFEDDPYGHLRFEGEHEPTIFSLDKDGIVLYACSFSKILAPGTRVAWVVAPEDVIKKMVMIKQGSDLCTSVVSQALVYEYCRLGLLDSFLPKILDHYKKKRDGMKDAFQTYLPEDAEYQIPQGGFFYWLRLPGMDTKEVFYKAVDRGVAFVIGESFFPNGGGSEYLRTCYTFAESADFVEGSKRLALAIQDVRK